MFKGLTTGLSVALFALTTGMAMAQDDGSDVAVDEVPDGIFYINEDGVGEDSGTGGGDDGLVTIDPIDVVYDDPASGGEEWLDPAAGGEGDPDVVADGGEVPMESDCGGCEYFSSGGRPEIENQRGDVPGPQGGTAGSWDFASLSQRPATPDLCESITVNLGWFCKDFRQ